MQANGEMIKPKDLANIYLEIKLLFRGIGRKMKGADMEKKSGQMEPHSKANIETIKKMEEVNLDGQMEMNMLANSKIIVSMAKG